MSWLRYKIVDGYAVGIFDNGQEVMFDIEDLEKVSAHAWYIDSMGYVATAVNRGNVRMHRFFVRDVPDGMVIDHINRNKLDNRMENLRVCTQKENVHNSTIRKNNTSGTPGVFFDKKVRRWRTQIYKDGKCRHVGIFDSYDDAVVARKKAENEMG